MSYERQAWMIAVVSASVMAGCQIAESPASTLPPEFTPPAGPAASATLSLPTGAPSPATAAPSPRPEPTPTLTPAPRAEIWIAFTDCTWKFCPPEELDQYVASAARRPGILQVEILDEFHAHLVYDPTQLTEAQAVQLFASATGLHISESDP